MASRLFSNQVNTTPLVDTGTTVDQGDRNINVSLPQWLGYQTSPTSPVTQANSLVYVSGPEEASFFMVAIAMSNTVGGGGSPPSIGWPDVAFFGCAQSETSTEKVTIINQACSALLGLAESQANEDLEQSLTSAGYPFSTGTAYTNVAKILNGTASSGTPGVNGKKCPIAVFENGSILTA